MGQGTHQKIGSFTPSEHTERHESDGSFSFWGTGSRENNSGTKEQNQRLTDKRVSLSQAMERYLRDGMHIAIGGYVNTRTPIAAVHEIIRQGARNLTLSFQSNSFCCELLAGAMILDPDRISMKRVELAWYGNGITGIAPLLGYLTSRGMIELDCYSTYGISARFKAGAMGIPFIPIREETGADKEFVNQGKMMSCPFTDENVYLVPACKPELGIVHVQAADMFGNSRLFGPLSTCTEIAQASEKTIVTTDMVIDNTAIRKHPNLTQLPYSAVDAVVDQPFGATPGSCYGYYWFDMAEIQEFRRISEIFRATGEKGPLQDYYNANIFDVADFDEHLELKPYPVLKTLCKQDGDQPVIMD